MDSKVDDPVGIFDIDAANLMSAVNDVLSQPKLDINQIIPIYYQVMTVKSLGKILQEQIDSSPSSVNRTKNSILSEKITMMQSFISEQFDSKLHKMVLTHLADSVTEKSEKLRSGGFSEKSKEQIESDANMYEDLRQIMSTKEFIEQYEKGCC